jgi:sugar phosphate isomerase/epimerase
MTRYSLPTINWVRMPGGDGSDSAEAPTATRTLHELFGAASSAGFTAVGVDGFTVDRFQRTGGLVDELAAELKLLALSCTEIGVLSVGQTDGMDAATSLAALGAAVGAHLCITVVDAEVNGEAVARLKACAEILAPSAIRMALEFMPYGPLATLGEAIEICDAVGWDRCGILLDSWHFFNSGAPWPDLAALDGDQIPLVQINDARPPIGTDLKYESRFRRVPPGEGMFALDEFVTAVVNTGFDGIVSPEVLSTALIHAPLEQGAAGLMDALVRNWPM